MCNIQEAANPCSHHDENLRSCMNWFFESTYIYIFFTFFSDFSHGSEMTLLSYTVIHLLAAVGCLNFMHMCYMSFKDHHTCAYVWTCDRLLCISASLGTVMSEMCIGSVLQTPVYIHVSSRSWIMSCGGRLAVPMLDSGWLRVHHIRIIQNNVRHMMESHQINWQTTLPNSRQTWTCYRWAVQLMQLCKITSGEGKALTSSGALVIACCTTFRNIVFVHSVYLWTFCDLQ